MSVFALKNSCCKTFRKTAENPWKECNFCSDQVFPFEFCEIFINSGFLEHRHGVAFAKTYCLQKEKVGKKNVLGGSSFVVLIIFFDSFTYK